MAEHTSQAGKAASADGPLGGLGALRPALNELAPRQPDRLSALLEIGTALSSARQVDELLALVVERLTALVNAEACTLFMYDERRSELWSRVLRGSDLKEIRVPSTTGVVGHVLSAGTTVRLDDAYADSRFNPEIDRISGFQTRSIVAAPLRHTSGRLLGVLEVIDRRAEAFTAEDQFLVEAVAAQIAAVLDNVLLLDQLQSQNEELRSTQRHLSEAISDLDLLYQVERAISSAEHQQDVLEQVVAKMSQLVGAEATAILLVEDQQCTYFRQGEGGGLIPMAVRPGQGLAWLAARRQTCIRFSEGDLLQEGDLSFEEALGLDVRSALCVPIAGQDRVLGALELINKPGGFNDGDERLATLLAGQTGRAILLRRAREEGEKRGRMAAIGQMLSGLLHDLRTPMMVISGYAEMLAEPAEAAERKRISGIIGQQVDHIEGMIRETLAFARGERDLLVRKIFLGPFLEDVDRYLRKHFEQSGSSVVLKIDARYRGEAWVDEGKLKRVVYNIAGNAIEAMPNGGSFRFICDRQGNELVLSFEDSGPGIPPQIAARLFQSFVSAGKANGTGLGLAIVKKIAEEHGGKVAFQSRSGAGVVFEVRMPVCAPPT